MKFIQCLHMPKLSPSSKLQLNQNIYVSPASNLSFWSDFQFVKQLYFILLHLGWKLSRAFSHTYELPSPKFGSIYYTISPVQFFQVSVQSKAIWSKCYFCSSKWPETFWASSYLQLIGPCPFQIISCTHMSASSKSLFWTRSYRC